MKIVWSPQALEKAGELTNFIAEDSVNRANKWIETIFEKVEQLETLPMIGRKLPDQDDDNLRQLIIDNYHVIYRITKKEIRILVIRNFKDNKSI